MTRLFSFWLAVIIAVALPVFALAITQSGKRQLVYSFSVGVKDDKRVARSVSTIEDSLTYAKGDRVGLGAWDSGGQIAVHNAENLMQHGSDSYVGSVSDKGEITIDIVGMQPDGALVVSVRERADQRSSGAIDCLVYQDTEVKCAAPVFPEELAVMRTLSPKFLDPAFADAGRSWHVEHGTQGVPSDFRVEAKALPEVTVDEQRSMKMSGTNRGLITTEAKYVYDQNRLLPTSVDEYTLLHWEQDAGHTTDTTVDITAHLIADSATK